MNEAEAKAWEGKRVRTVDNWRGVPKGMAGTMVGARTPGIKILVSSVNEDETILLTNASWCVDMKPDNPLYSPFPVWEWYGSLEEL